MIQSGRIFFKQSPASIVSLTQMYAGSPVPRNTENVGTCPLRKSKTLPNSSINVYSIQSLTLCGNEESALYEVMRFQIELWMSLFLKYLQPPTRTYSPQLRPAHWLFLLLPSQSCFLPSPSGEKNQKSLLCSYAEAY